MAVLAIAGSCSIAQSVYAASPVFAFTNRDLLLCVRKTGATGGSSSPLNLEVNLGQASQYYNATAGSIITNTPFTSVQLSNVFDNLNDLSWSVAGVSPIGDTGSTDIPTRTLWVSAPRTDSATPAPYWLRQGPSVLGNTAAKIKSIFDNAFFQSSITAGSSSNTTSLTVVPVGSGHEFGAFMGQFGNYANTFQGKVENTTSSTFVADGVASRSDLYELRPDSTGTQPSGKYLGYFELQTSGTVLFVASPAPTIAIAKSGNTNTISFATTGNTTYTLCYTNIGGLTSPTATWPVATSIVGTGSSVSLKDTTTDDSRVYRVLKASQ